MLKNSQCTVVKRVPILIFFKQILCCKHNLYIIIGGSNQMEVVILTQKCPPKEVEVE